jgi:carbon storage regulator
LFGVAKVRLSSVIQTRKYEMLVLSRKPGERIMVGDDVVITIVRIGPNNVRVGIEAPRSMNIVREESNDRRNENVATRIPTG